jgi:protein-S-isoprenylcysteine O-methyltransferase
MTDTVRLAFLASYGAWILMEIWIFSRDRRAAGGEKKDRGSVFFIIATISIGQTLAFYAPHLWPSARIPAPVFWPGVTLVWLGIGLRIWAVQTLGKHFRTAVRILDDHTLVTSGPYRVLRHPSYTGDLIAVAGIGLMLGNWLSLAAAFGGIFIGYAVRIVVEEAALAGRFGEAFTAHKKRTWAVLPPVW